MAVEYALGAVDMMKAQGRIVAALMLHDIKARFGGNQFGFLVMGVGWPLSHIVLLIVINAELGRVAPYGDNAALFFATGIIPFMAFNYMSRLIMLGVVLNRPLLSFPIVKITDILFARAIVEALNAGLVVLILFGMFWALGINFMPLDIVQASLALLAMMLLGLGFGVVNAIIAAAIPFWITGYVLFMIISWAASGVLFVPDSLPEAIRTPLSYLPMLQGVEWMRSAYYEGYGTAVLDKPYLIAFGSTMLFVGLTLERLVRGRLLQ
jgi:capsular polysaccharide transport system permease protein